MSLLMTGTLMLGCDGSADNEPGAAIGSAICAADDAGAGLYDAGAGLYDGGSGAVGNPVTGIDGGLLDAGGGVPLTPPLPPPPMEPDLPLTEPQIVGITLSVHVTEVNSAKLAQARAMDVRVRALADELVLAHEAGQQRLIAVGIPPEASPGSAQLEQAAATAQQLLAGTPDGAAFDRTWVEALVVTHGRLRTLFDGTLRRQATTPELVTELKRARDETVAHLVDAQALVDGPRTPMGSAPNNPGTGGNPAGGTAGSGGISTGGPGLP